jgi:hypothetical protein
VRPKADCLGAADRAEEAVLRDRGIAHPRCGIDRDHPLACHEPDGDPIPSRSPESWARCSPPETSDVRHLAPAQADRWLCRHSEQRPGADFGEKPAPTQGYEDCG